MNTENTISGIDISERLVSDEADYIIRWGAGRAFAIAAVPLPLADVTPLIANEGYMFYKLGKLYGYEVDETMKAAFFACLGASVGGKIFASFLPFLKAPISAAMTYGVGKAMKVYFESGTNLPAREITSVFERLRKEGETISWK